MKVLLALLLALSASAAARSQEGTYWKWDNGIGHSNWDLALEKEDAERMRRLWDAIGEDLKTERNGLAGTYVKGGYSAGYFFRWSVRKGYVLIPYFDQNLIADFSYGAVDFVDASEVNFTPERDLRRGSRSIDEMPRKWAAVGKHFVPVEMLKDLGDYMAGLGEFNEFSGRCCEFTPNFLARRIDRPEAKSDYGVPPKYARFLRPPIRAEITSVGKKKTVKGWSHEGKLYGDWMERAVLIPVRVSVGRAHGVKRGMFFRLLDGVPDYNQYIQITRVGRRTASGYVVHDISFGGKETYKDWETDEEKPFPPVRTGTKVTTSPILD